MRLKCHYGTFWYCLQVGYSGSFLIMDKVHFLWVVIFSFLEAIGSYWLYSWCDFCCADLMSFMCVVKRLHCLASCPCPSQSAQFFMPWFSIRTVGIIFWDANTLYWSVCLCVCVQTFCESWKIYPVALKFVFVTWISLGVVKTVGNGKTPLKVILLLFGCIGLGMMGN